PWLHLRSPLAKRPSPLFASATRRTRMRRSVGLDLGTTNSAIGVAGPDGRVTLADFDHGGRVESTFRSILYFHPDAVDERRAFTAVAGPTAIARYLEADGTG